MIIPGILEKDFEEIVRKVKKVEQFASLIQIDIADGKLVDGETIRSVKILDQLKTKASLEVHLMVENPTAYVQQKVHNVSRICTQVEVGNSKETVQSFIEAAKKLNYQVGLSINVKTPMENLEPFVEKIDYVQFMSVEPGGQGRPFDEQVFEKIKNFRKKHAAMPIQIDGGVNASNLHNILTAGVNDVIIGSALFNEPDIRSSYIKFKDMQND
jgi:ribulose-phosphate 3-epimerase